VPRAESLLAKQSSEAQGKRLDHKKSPHLISASLALKPPYLKPMGAHKLGEQKSEQLARRRLRRPRKIDKVTWGKGDSTARDEKKVSMNEDRRRVKEGEAEEEG
jgi:hypothetical protein